MKGKKIVLLADFNAVAWYRKQQARQSLGALVGVWVTTPADFLREAWSVWGSGERIVSPHERMILLGQVLAASHTFLRTQGGVAEFAALAQELIGTPFYQGVCKQASQYSALTQAIIAEFERYRSLLADRECIEVGDALRHLASAMPHSVCEVEKRLVRSLPLAEFAAEWDATVFDSASVTPDASEALSAADGAASSASVQAELLFPLGVSAKSHAVLDALDRHQPHRMLMVSAHPTKAYQDLADALVKRGFSVALQARKPFTQTFFGRAYQACRTFLSGEELRSSVIDYLHSPYGASQPAATYELDVLLERAKPLDQRKVLDVVRELSPHIAYLEELFSEPDASVVCDYFSEVATAAFADTPAILQEELQAIRAIKNLYEVARPLTSHLDDLEFLVEGLSVPVRRRRQTDGQRSVLIADAQAALGCEAQSFDVVLMSDLDSETYALSREHEGMVQFCEDIGYTLENSRADDLRSLMTHAQACAKSVFICEQVLTHESGDTAYPCFFFDEYLRPFVDADAKDRFPFNLNQDSVSLYTYSEGPFVANLACDEVVFATQPQQPRHTMSSEGKSKVFLPRGMETDKDFILSPSAIELYLACPYRWFVERRLRPNDPYADERAIERGNIAHAVYQAFYAALEYEVGKARVTPQNVNKAQELFSLVFDEVVASAQANLFSPTSQQAAQLRRPNALMRLEETALRAQLEKTIGWFADIMPGYRTYAHEYELGSKRSITYAGFSLVGRVDRVDVNDDLATYAVIDYKGSVGSYHAGYKPDKEEFTLPNKVQALIYAQALRQELPDLHPAAALYFGYRSKDEGKCLAGSYSPSSCDVSRFSEGTKSAVQASFDAYLDQVEAALAPYLERMVAGEISPNPHSKDACKYCPVPECERKLS